MKRALGIISLFILFCSVANAQAPQAIAGATMAPQILFVNNDSAYDFGGIPAGSTIEYQFEIRNTGNAPLVISGIKCESGFVQCKGPAKSIKPGKKGLITVSYAANGDEGSFKNDITITSNATASPYPFIHITGAVIPAGGSYVPSSMGTKKGGGRAKHQ